MNYARLVLTAAVAWVVDSLYGFLVFGVAMASEFDRYRPGVFRAVDVVNARLPLMFASMFVAILVLAYIYAKGYEGGPGVGEGLRFGIVVGLFVFFFISVPDFVVFNYGRRLAAEMAVATFVELVVMGIVFGLMYRPAARMRTAAP